MERPSAPKAIGGEVLPPGAEPLQADDPPEIDGHRLVARLAAGGTSIVYLAHDPGGEHVALKTTRATDQTQARRWLRTEASCARRLPPFCTAALRSDGTDHTPPYLVSEYIEGPSLAQYVDGLGPLDAEQLMALAVALGRAIAAVHGAGLIHCDLKPTNVLLASNGPRIIDFSIAQEAPVSGRPGELGTVPYSPGWVAPERADGFPASPASDVFGWGRLVMYAATGLSPADGDGGRWSVAGEEELAALSEPVRGLVEAALAVNPADRPSTGEIAARLGGGTDKAVDQARPVAPLAAERDVPARPAEPPVDAPTAPMSAVEPDLFADLGGAAEPGAALPRRRPGQTFTTAAQDEGGYPEAPAVSPPPAARRPQAQEPRPRRVEYSSDGMIARSRPAPRRRPRRLRAVAMVTAPAAVVAVIATVIAMAATGTKNEPAGPSSAVRPGQAPVDSEAPSPPAPVVPGRRSSGPRHGAADPRHTPSPSPTPGARRHTGATPPRSGGGSHKPAPPHSSSPPPASHTPTPTPTPTPTGTGPAQGGTAG